jgi:hypothetical protein
MLGPTLVGLAVPVLVGLKRHENKKQNKKA